MKRLFETFLVLLIGLQVYGAVAVPRPIQSYDSVADLVAAQTVKVYPLVHVKGYYAPGDGGGGFFIPTNTVTSTNYGSRINSGVASWSWEAQFDKGQIDVKRFGAKGDGATDDMAKLKSAIDAGIASGRTVLFPSGTFLAAGRVDVTGSVRIVSEGGVLHKTHGTDGLRVKPASAALGTSAAGTTNTSVIITGAGWDVDEYADTWVELATSSIQTRRVVSNTSDTLTLEYSLDNVSAVGVAVTSYVPIAKVVIDGLEIDGNGGAGDSLEISHVDDVEVRNVKAHSNTGNAAVIYHARKVRLYGGEYNDSTFGLFIYNSDDVLAVGPSAKRNTGEYGIQIKDCRNAQLVGAFAEDNADVGLNIKASGLNPTWNCSILNGVARNNLGAGVKAHALVAEGTRFFGENYSIVNASDIGSVTGIQVNDNSGAAPLDVKILGGQVRGSTTSGVALQANGAICEGVLVEACENRAMDISSTNVVVRNCRFANNNTTGADREVRLAATSANCEIRDCEFVRESGSSDGAVQEITGGSGNIISGNRIYDPAAAYTTYYTLTAAGADTFYTFTSTDATPTVKQGRLFITANASATTITALDNGMAGQQVTILINDANTTFDFTGTTLKGNGGVDWTPTTGDHLTAVFDGTNWHCRTVDNTP